MIPLLALENKKIMTQEGSAHVSEPCVFHFIRFANSMKAREQQAHTQQNETETVINLLLP